MINFTAKLRYKFLYIILVINVSVRTLSFQNSYTTEVSAIAFNKVVRTTVNSIETFGLRLPFLLNGDSK